MTRVIGVVSQKGGVGKSTISLMLAREFTQSGWEVLIADMDSGQASANQSNMWRMENGIQPELSVMQFSTVDKALKKAVPYDLVIFDGAPHSTRNTEQIGQASDIIILPTGLSRNDLVVQVKLAHEFTKKGIENKKIAFVLSRAGTSSSEISAAREYIQEAGYKVLKYEIYEKAGYRAALDVGKTITEVSFPTLREKAERIAQSIINEFESIEESVYN
ncbi:MAG: ParA family protein [Okeania sp. SIO3C4]|nr:ParA family protein [Okeania sp. SIO3C4]